MHAIFRSSFHTAQEHCEIFRQNGFMLFLQLLLGYASEYEPIFCYRVATVNPYFYYTATAIVGWYEKVAVLPERQSIDCVSKLVYTYTK